MRDKDMSYNVPNLGEIKVKKLDSNAILPYKSTDQSVGYDLYASKSVSIGHGQVAMVSTGLAFELPVNVKMDIRPRSSYAAKNILIANSPATIDSDYRGEVKVLIKNDSGSTLTINKGDKMSQAVFSFRYEVSFKEVNNINETQRGQGGFGSTGK